MRQYCFYSHGDEFRLRLKISTGKYEIVNNEIELVDSGYSLFQITEKNESEYCNSVIQEFIQYLNKREKK